MVHAIFAVAVLLSAVYFKIDKKRFYLFQVSFVVIFLFAVLRYNYGNDYTSYFNKYNDIQNGYNDVFNSEYLFEFINRISPSFYLLVAVISFFFIFVVYKLIKDIVPIKAIWIGVFILLFSPYIFLMNLSAMRQCIATSLFIIAVHYCEKRNFWKFAFFIVIAMFFHMSAVVLLPVYFIISSKPINKWQFITIVSVIAVILIGQNLFDNIINSVIGFLNIKNYSAYFNSDANNSVRSAIVSVLPLLYLLYNCNKTEGMARICSKLTIVAYVLSILAVYSTSLIRIRMYFEVFSVVSFPCIMYANIKETPPVAVTNFERIFNFVNKYVFPILIFAILIFKYISFFRDPTWQSFYSYNTLFELL